MSKVLEAICNIMTEVGSIEKSGVNTFHNYKYATAADLNHAVQPLLAKHGLVVLQTEAERKLEIEDSAWSVTYEFMLAHTSGETWPERFKQTGQAGARNAKGGPDDKALNKTFTAARKYFLLGLFCIPTGDYDDADAADDAPAQTRAAAAPPRPPPPPLPHKAAVAPVQAKADGQVWLRKYVAAINNTKTNTDLLALANHPDNVAWRTELIKNDSVNATRLAELIARRLAEFDVLPDPIAAALGEAPPPHNAGES